MIVWQTTDARRFGALKAEEELDKHHAWVPRAEGTVDGGYTPQLGRILCVAS